MIRFLLWSEPAAIYSLDSASVVVDYPAWLTPIRLSSIERGPTMILQPSIADSHGEPVSRGSLRAQVTARLVTGIFAGSLRSGQRWSCNTSRRLMR